MSDSNRVPSLKQLARRVVINAENCILDVGVGRGLSTCTQQFIPGGYVFPCSASYDYVLEHNRVPRLVHGEIRFGGDDQAECLHVGEGLPIDTPNRTW